MRQIKSVLLLGAAVALVAGCSATPTEPEVAYADGGTFTIAVAADPGTLNPLNNNATAASWFNRFLYDQLTTRTPEGEISAGLADEWEFDGTTAVFHIREGVTCYDGSPVTPSVVAKTFDYISNPDNPSTPIGSIIPNRNFTYEADDEAGTFTLTLKAPFSLLLSSISFLHIPCGPGADDPTSIVTTSSGSGPFVLESATPNSEYVMTKREGYTWGFDGGTTDAPGTPDKVVFKIVENETTAANLLASGEVNAAVVNGQDRLRLEAAGLDSQTYIGGGVVMSFNEAEGKITADQNVRLALAMAFDRADAATAVTGGLITEAGTSVSAAQPQVCNDDAAAESIPEYDVDAAIELLEEAGWVEGADGIREKDGQRFSFRLSHSTVTPGAAAAVELIADAWSELGADVIITPLAQADYSQKMFSTGDYDTILQQLSNPFPSTLTGLMGGGFPPNGTNAGHVVNQAYKDAIAIALVTPGEEGCEAWVDASRALFEHMDMLPISAWPTNWITTGAQMDTLGGRPIPTTVRLLAE